MFRIWSYFTFLIRSTNQYGIHSPFVYQYLTRCLYRKSRNRRSKVQKVLMKSIPYFKYESVHLFTDQRQYLEAVREEYPEVESGRKPSDLIFIGGDYFEKFDFDSLEQYSHNKTMILLEGINNNRRNRKVWSTLCEKAWIRVSIDFYHGGILFLRKEQEKQHFHIRI
ncbi:hypothetical protein ACA086_06910 [Muriicola sp. E247]|uniref:hypothetical protein n=1 Tax=Muriicola sp. E247 TaxID=3242730 RepID=UPI0035258CE0